MICRAGLDESDMHPATFPPLEAMAMCQSLTQSAGRRIPSRATARNGSYDNKMCRAGWMKAIHPATFPRWM